MKLARQIEKEESGDMVAAKHEVKMQEHKKRQTKEHTPILLGWDQPGSFGHFTAGTQLSVTSRKNVDPSMTQSHPKLPLILFHYVGCG